ncbi:hypothetical protein [Thermaurantiacus sp.]
MIWLESEPERVPLVRQPLVQALSNILFLLGIFLSPYYFWSSGLPQISHIVLAWGALAVFAKGEVIIHNPWRNAFIFCVYTLSVNSIVAAVNGVVLPLLSSAYYFFNLMIVVGLVNAAIRTGLDQFLRWCHWVLLTALMIQTTIIVSGLGRTFETIRATGTFNDPNQLAHWLIWNVISVLAIGRAIGAPLRVGVAAFAIALPAVVLSASRSGFLGMSIVFLSLIMLLANKLSFYWKNSSEIIRILGRAALILALGSLAFASNELFDLALDIQVGWNILDRFSEIGAFTSLEGRGYDRIWKFPHYLVFGAGEAVNSRWSEKTWFLLEIHSTIGGVLFSYGVIGLLLLFVMITPAILYWRDWKMRILLLAPLVYSIATYNLRNTMFWVGLALTVLAALRVRGGVLVGAAEISRGTMGSARRIV